MNFVLTNNFQAPFIPELGLESCQPVIVRACTSKVPGCGDRDECLVEALPGYVTAEPIQSFIFGGTDMAGSATSTGRPTLQNFLIAKSFDSCSGTWITAFLTSEPLKTVTLYAVKTEGDSTPPPFLTITLTNVVVYQYTVTGNATNGNPLEHISLTFETATIKALKANGGGSTTITYNALSNQLDQ